MIRINDILDKISEYHPEADLDVVQRAYIYSARVHDGQVRLSGEPYLSHPLEVAGILSDMQLDATSIAAALLHDVIEDTHATEEELTETFGEEVCRIVAGVTKISKLSFTSAIARQAESMRKMILAMADDIRVILIKLADRLHNMKTIQYHKNIEKRVRIAQETLEDIYAPISARLGIYWLKHELEDIAFLYVNTEEYGKIKNLVQKDEADREKYVVKVRDHIQDSMQKAGIKGEVSGRYKKYYSIYSKMLSQNLAFEEIYDITGFRVILDTISQCYEVLGIVHAMWKPIPLKFKDYIGAPKPNMYQSLHTTVIGPYGERIEIQIRTHEMDQIAKSGIAAHWSYKEGRSSDENMNKAFAWIENLVENQENFSDPNEYLDNVRIDLFPDDVYVFTPRGEIKSLPRGATPVDYAYLIHTEVGNQCIGAKVNGRMVPLKYQLYTGEIVEVITSKGHHPSKDWLNFVKTVKARSRIRQWIKIQEKERSVSLGKEMCEKAFRKYKLNFNTLIKTDQMEEVVKSFGLKSPDDMVANVGYGKLTPLQIIQKIAPKNKSVDEDEKSASIIDKVIGRVRKKKPSSGVIVNGVDDILIKFGKCCRPLPGDPITGYITLGYGVTVHRTSCVNALKMNPERQIHVEWDEVVAETYPVRILVNAYDRFGLLSDITAKISKNGANILHVISEIKEDSVVECLLTLNVIDTDHLKRVLSAIKKVKSVQDVQRLDR